MSDVNPISLVTGGAGFIGSNLCRLLLEHGHEVRVLDDFSSGHRDNLSPLLGRLRVVEGDIRDRTVVRRSVAGVDYVFHLAASVGNKRSLENPIEDAQVNLIGTLVLLETLRESGVKKLVYSSSAGVFGELREFPISESHPTEPDSPYGTTKLAAEKMCRAYARLYGIPTVALRYFNVFGVHQRFDAYGNVIPIFVSRMLRNIPLVIYGDGEQSRDFVNVLDVTMANLRAARAEKVHDAVFNIGSGACVTINRIVELLSDLIGRPLATEYAPPRPGDVRHSLADISAARSAIGFNPTVTFEEGLRDFVDWTQSSLEAPS